MLLLSALYVGTYYIATNIPKCFKKERGECYLRHLCEDERVIMAEETFLKASVASNMYTNDKALMYTYTTLS